MANGSKDSHFITSATSLCGIFENLQIISSGIPFNELIFEAPLRHQQVWFIENYGVDTNFGNIALNDIIGLETFRRGLRGDTLFLQSS